jgi:diacylglycerol kinase (ATP)
MSHKNRAFFPSFTYAARGIMLAFSTEANLRRQFVLLCGVFALAWWLQVSALEWLVIIVASGAVITVELINSALEALADAVHPEQHPQIAFAKDVSAGAVLLMCTTAAIVGLLIFLR